MINIPLLIEERTLVTVEDCWIDVADKLTCCLFSK